MFVCRILSVLSIILFSYVELSWSYKRGDEVNLLFKTSTKSWSGALTTIDALRHQMPTFGYDTKVQIDVSTLMESSSDLSKIKSISLSVASHDLPWIPMQDERDRKLNVLDMQLKYMVGVNGRGEVNAVTVHSEYSDRAHNDNEDHTSFTINYTWLREAEIDQHTGILVMAIVTVLITLVTFLRACNESEEGEFDESYTKKVESQSNHHQHIYKQNYKNKTNLVTLRSTSKKE